jgi:ABC-type antimicrobial peptide transport system permease subunit
MIASVIFYSMLIKVIFKARINEIGVFRSVGSTIKDIKKLFFYEVIYIFTTATVLTIVLLTLVVTGINGLFLRFAELNSRVISFANVHLLISENLSIVNISYINLAFQIIIVVSLILYISNRNITKVVNTNPIDILREVV